LIKMKIAFFTSEVYPFSKTGGLADVSQGLPKAFKKKGEDIRKINIPKNCVFIIGDHEGLPKKELKRLKNYCKPVSIGNKMYFASQTVAVVNNELDYRNI